MREAPTRQRAVQVLVAMATACLLAAGCGDGNTTASTDDTPTPADQSTESDNTDTPTDNTADTSVADTATTTTVADATTSTGNTAIATDSTSDEGIVIEASVVGGSVDVVADRVEIDLGSTVTIRIDADAADHIHLHGYDVLADVAPGSPAEMIFTADVPGVFEIELEDSGTFLFEIVVS